MPRHYKKSSNYWGMKSQFAGGAVLPSNNNTVLPSQQMAEAQKQSIDYQPIDEPFMKAEAGSSSEYRVSQTSQDVGLFKQEGFSNIMSGFSPYYLNTNGFVTISFLIDLLQHAYANVSAVRNTIDVCSEFSNSKIHLQGGNEASKKFFYRWFDKIGLAKLKEQFFREYYRSGNVFMYKFEGQFGKDDFAKLQRYGVSKQKIPLKYTVLNPYTIASWGALGVNFNYVRLLSPYEIERLRNPKTPEDLAVFKSLSPEIQKRIKTPSVLWREMYIPLDPEKLFFVFYKKQDYEPFAVPMAFPVMYDVEHKLQLKKMDAALTRTIENVILLITMGAEKDKGGINYQNIAAMQTLLQNRAAGRVIVSDYTTKAKFITPDIHEILGKDKYEVVNQDIIDGLQSILMGSEKFANQFIKTKVFLERLSEGQDAFVNNFLYGEMVNLAKQMNFSSCPVPVFEKIDLKDEIQYAKVITRLTELGILTPEQTLETMSSGLLPETSSLMPAQQTYKQQRDEGLFLPLVGASQQQDEQLDGDGNPIKTKPKKPAGRPTDSGGTPKSVVNVGPIGSGNSHGGVVSTKELQKVVMAATKLQEVIEEKLKLKHKIEKLNKKQKELAYSMASNVITQCDMPQWDSASASLTDNLDMSFIDKNVVDEIEKISTEMELGRYESSLLYHSKKIKE